MNYSHFSWLNNKVQRIIMAKCGSLFLPQLFFRFFLELSQCSMSMNVHLIKKTQMPIYWQTHMNVHAHTHTQTHTHKHTHTHTHTGWICRKLSKKVELFPNMEIILSTYLSVSPPKICTAVIFKATISITKLSIVTTATKLRRLAPLSCHKIYLFWFNWQKPP